MEDPDSASDVFELIGNGDRLSILRALIEQRRTADDPYLRFSELRDRSEIEDTGRFNYHLDQLRGTFVTKGEPGYRLSSYGHRITAPMMGGIHDPDREVESIETPGECPECEESLEIRAEGTVLRIVCRDGHVLNQGLLGYPGILDTREPSAANDALGLINTQAFERGTNGICPTCHGPVDGQIEHDEGERAWFFQAPCRTCGNQFAAPVGACVATHPDVVSFFADHDVDIRTAVPWSFSFQYPGVERVVSEEPLRLAVDIEYSDERLVVTVDRSGTVVSTGRRD